MLGLCHWLQNLHWAVSLRESDWLFPLVEGSHLLALPLSVGLILFFDLRLLGLALRSGLAPKPLSILLRWSRIGFVVMFTTGGLLFVTQAEKAYGNPFFRAKMLLLLLLGVNAAIYQVIFFPRMARWDSVDRIPLGARVCAGLSLVFWIGVIVCGRTMAYQL